MEDNRLTALFSDFEPAVSSDSQFLSKLERNLDYVEIIKQHTAEARSRNRKAVVIAALVGFIVGVLFSLTLPYLGSVASQWQMTLPSGSMLRFFANNFTIVAWSVIGGTSALAALNSYEITLSLLKRRQATQHRQPAY